MENDQNINIAKARNMLQNLIAKQSPDTRLLHELKQELTQAVQAGVSLKQIWDTLREVGFAGNQTKLSNWLEAQGIRQKMDKKGNGSRKKGKHEAQNPETQP